MAFKEWVLRPQNAEAVKKIENELSLSHLAASVLAARGYDTVESVRRDILCEDGMESPFALADMDKACSRIRSAFEDGEIIAVFGDYDVDGVTATALVYSYLTSVCENEIILRLPDRKTEGYGLSETAVHELCDRGVSLIITVDNGVAAHREIELAASLGIDVVVCDHHIAPEILPKAVAVVDPNRADCKSSFKSLAGVGVALKLCAAIEDCPTEQMADYFGYFAALGTVADVMPLIAENRYLVKTGLEQLRQGANFGISALMELASISPEKLDARSVSFGIAPRLNAAGRIGSAEDSLSLLIDEERAEELAQKINGLNNERRQLEQNAEQAINAVFLADPGILMRPIIVVGDTGLSGGVIGIVASRLVEKYGKPAIVYNEASGILKGSCRSVEGFSIFDALSACSEHLDQFGGHAMAAGLSLSKRNLSKFVSALSDYCKEHPIPHSTLLIDCLVSPEQLSEEEINGLNSLEPFGKGNEEPVFAVRNAEITEISVLAEKYTQYKLKASEAVFRIADFSASVAETPYQVGDKIDAAFNASVNTVRDRKYISFKLVSSRISGFTNAQLRSSDIFSSFDANSRWRPEYSQIAISREEVAVVYRLLCSRRYNERDLSPLVMESKLAAGKVLAAVAALKELGLVSPGSLRIRKTSVKRELSDSCTFFVLNRGAK